MQKIDKNVFFVITQLILGLQPNNAHVRVTPGGTYPVQQLVLKLHDTQKFYRPKKVQNFQL